MDNKIIAWSAKRGDSAHAATILKKKDNEITHTRNKQKVNKYPNSPASWYPSIKEIPRIKWKYIFKML